jgi:primosomal protein N' (replication factor Y)
VIVQTVNPGHYSIIAGSNHDYEGFARQELLYRSELNYPPFRHIIRILVSGEVQERIKEVIDKIAQQITKELAPSPFPLPDGERTLRTLTGSQSENPERVGEGKLIEAGDIEILGPAPAPILRIRDRFRWHLVLKIKDLSSVQKYFKEMFKMPFVKGGVQVSIDTDPVSLL